MNTLFIDTHCEELLVALLTDGKVIKEIKSKEKSHSEKLMPSIIKVLNDSNLKKENLNEIIVVNGPGSFTGIRIGVTVAKTLAYALKLNIKTITSLEAYGESDNNDFDIIAFKDTKGFYSAIRKDGEYQDFEYRKTDDFNEYIKSNNYKCSTSTNIDLEKVYNYLKNKESINPHAVNPVYIKRIDALK